jgi:murein DD-endopeptidase MepM/ murein hydrolase activator NlpD
MIGRCAVVALLLGSSAVHGLDLILPTENTALLTGRDSDFYQSTERTFRGVKSTPWEAGRYGFVRDPDEITGEFHRFHEGIDIQPLQRDPSGVPIDRVRAVADGTVVHVNSVPHRSNYGIYVVVQHIWDGCKYYSLYGHLARTTVPLNSSVAKGEQIGVIGSTGAGINQSRAHLHFEINLMLSRTFDEWHAKYFPTETNHHGLYNGLNLAGIDVATLFLELQRDPSLTIPRFLSQQQVAYKVRLPHTSKFVLPQLYDWMRQGPKNSPAWIVSFARSGLPLRIETAPGVSTPAVHWVFPSRLPLHMWTKGVVTGDTNNFRLTQDGLRYAHLLIGSHH